MALVAQSTFAAAYDAATSTRIAGPSWSDYDAEIRQRHSDLITVPASPATAAADHFDLGPVGKDNLEVIPELCFVRYPTGSTGTMTSVVFTLAKVNTAGTVVDLTGPVTASGAIGEAFTDFAAATTLPTCSASDRFRLVITSQGAAIGAGRTFNIEIAYRCKNG